MPRTAKPPIEVQMLSDYSRNIEFQCFRRQWTVEDLVSKTSLSKNTIQRIRANRHKQIDAHALTCFCSAFEVTPDELLLRHNGIAY
jgi:DNA-binding Xre family transcriptional regulator